MLREAVHRGKRVPDATGEYEAVREQVVADLEQPVSAAVQGGYLPHPDRGGGIGQDLLPAALEQLSR